jgi:2-haloacid dehalogenase
VKPLLAFDLNGTLIDTSSLDPFFVDLFGSSDKRREWFAQMIELAMATCLTGYFVEFGKLAQASLQMLADKAGFELVDQRGKDLAGRIRNMPLFPDVERGLSQFQQAGFRMVVLTNSAKSSAEATLEHARVLQKFERVLSVEMVRCYKPAAQVYQAAARELKASLGDVLMVAAHNWDTTGAIRAGCQAAFLRRPGEVLASTDPRPSYIATDLLDLASQLEKG